MRSKKDHFKEIQRVNPKLFFTLGAVAWFLGATVACAWSGDWYLARFYALSAAINLSMMIGAPT